MELIGLILGLVALGVGLYHVLEIKRALENLGAVQSSLSTRYLGKFPRFLGDIVDLVNSAQHDLVILCNFPGYGDLSEPTKALEYHQALERKKNADVNIEFTCLDAQTRKTQIREQFSASEWTTWQTDEDKKDKTLRFFRAQTNRSDPEKATVAEIVDALHELDERLLNQPYLKSVRQVALHMPMYFWIEDGQKAIFVIPTHTLAEGALEHGFLTADHALIQALLEMYERYKKAAAATSSTPAPATTPAVAAPPGTSAPTAPTLPPKTAAPPGAA